MTNREIAMTIGTTEQVVKNHVRKTFDKLGVWSRLELAMYVAAHGGAEWNRQPDLSAQPDNLPQAEGDTPCTMAGGDGRWASSMSKE